jgi:hypothetical protein
LTCSQPTTLRFQPSAIADYLATNDPGLVPVAVAAPRRLAEPLLRRAAVLAKAAWDQVE